MSGPRGLLIARLGSDLHVPRLEKEAFDAVGLPLDLVDDRDEGAIIEALKGADVAIAAMGFQPSTEMWEAMRDGPCQGVVTFGHGFDENEVAVATEYGIIRANTASFGTEEVSNQAIMHLMVCARKFVLHDKLMKQGVWTREHLAPMGHISGETLGIIGCGNIGRAVARTMKGFGVRILGWDPYVASWDMKEYGFEVAASMETLLEESDYVSLHTPYTKETHHMIGEREFKMMKPTAYIINTSRGTVVDEPALIQALKDGEIAGAGLDVFEQEPIDPDNELLTMDDVSVTNHYASYSEVAWERVARQMGEEAVRIALGYWPMSLINPEVASRIPPRKQARAWGAFGRD